MNNRLITLWQNQKGTAFFGVVLAMLFFTTMGITTVSLVANDSTGATGNLNGSQSFYVAEGGLQHVIMNELAEDTDFGDNVSPTDAPFGANSIALGDGEFWVEYLNQSSSSIDVRVTAQVGNAVRVVQQTVTPGSYPYSALVDGNFSLNNTEGTIDGDIGVNGNYNGDDMAVTGTIYEDMDIDMPTVDFAEYLDLIDTTQNGNYTISSDYTGNLRVTGNLKIDGNITITGILYVDGNVDFDGDNVTVNGTIVTEGNLNGNNHDDLSFLAQPLDDGTQMPALVVDGNITINNSENITIAGTVWADGNINMNSMENVNFVGSLISNGNINLENGEDIQLVFESDYMEGLLGFSDIPGAPGGGGGLTVSGWRSL